jgi:FkbH-like protein
VALTAEDRARSAMYGADGARRRILAASGDMDSYLRSLAMRLTIAYADEVSLPRIAQLTQKTNQFNLTTRRYSEGEIAAFMASPRHDVLSVRLSDALGDSGLVGVCILEYDGGRASIDTFLLSCRVLGRGVEAAFLAEALHVSRARGASVARGEYVMTAKNRQVERFFVEQGFSSIDTEGRLFERQLDALPFSSPGVFSVIESPRRVARHP